MFLFIPFPLTYYTYLFRRRTRNKTAPVMRIRAKKMRTKKMRMTTIRIQTM